MVEAEGVTPDDVLDAIRNRDREAHPVLSTTEIVERVDASRPTVKNRLDTLLERGELRMKTAGTAKVYWPAEENPIDKIPSEDRGVDVTEEARNEHRSDYEQLARRVAETSEEWAITGCVFIAAGVFLALSAEFGFLPATQWIATLIVPILVLTAFFALVWAGARFYIAGEIAFSALRKSWQPPSETTE